MTLTFGGQLIAAKPAATTTEHARIDATTTSPVLLFLRIVALNLDARRELREAVVALREIDVAALDDPALADHPRRAAMLRLYGDRCEAERLATTRLMELNVALEREWAALPVDVKHRFGLTFLVGEIDPDASILLRLWSEEVGLARLVPFPDRWAVPNAISHKALDTGIEIRDYSAAEVMNAPEAPF